MKKTSKLIGVVALLIAAFLYYYITLPAINIHATRFWFFLIGLAVALLVLYLVKVRPDREEFRESKLGRLLAFVILALIIVYLVGTILSSPIINAKKYQKLLTVEEGEFTADIEELSFDQIPLLDRD